MAEPKYEFKLPPYAHQKECLTVSWNKEYFGYLMEMGTGKSKTLIDNVGILYFCKMINAWLCIAPKGVYMNWVNKEIPEHLPDYIPRRVAFWTAPSARNRTEQEQLDDILKSSPEYLRILVMNIDAFATNEGVTFAYKFLESATGRALMSVDESTTIKNHEAQRTDYTCEVGRFAAYRRILTGSPIANSPLDIFGQAAFLDGWKPHGAKANASCMPYRLLGHASWYSFRARYAVLQKVPGAKSAHAKAVVGYKNIPELKELIRGWSYRVLKEDCLDLPPKTYMMREVQLTKEQVTAYKEMQSYAMTVIEGQQITVNTVLTLILRLHQIVCGHMTLPDGKVVTIKNHRLTELMDTIEETDGKIIIWANYRHDIEAICDELERRYGKSSRVSYYGDTRDADRQYAVSAFQHNPGVRFFVGNPSTGGYGITLTAASTTIYYSNSHSLEHRLQSEDRNHRIGQHWPVTYVDLVACGTVDEKILKALRNKIRLAEAVNGDNARDWLL